MFGGGLFGQQSTTTSTGGIGGILGNTSNNLGQPQQPQPSFGAPTGGLFGAPQQSTGLFGQAQGTQGQQPLLGGLGTGLSGGLGGGMGGGGLSGGLGTGLGGGIGGGLGMQQQPTQNSFNTGLGQPPVLGGIGGAQPAPSFGGLGAGLGTGLGTTGLGGGMGGAFGQPQAGLLGSQPQQQQGGLFGGGAATGGGLFGQQQQPQQQQGMFGAPQPQQQQGSLFGQQPAPAAQGFGTGLFGQTPQQPQQQAGFGFGQQTQQSATPGFGGGSLFGQPQQPQQQQSGFGFGGGQMGQPTTAAGQTGNQIVVPNGVDDSANDANLEQKVRLEDSISAITWGTQYPNFFAAASWDGKVRVFEIAQSSFKREIFERRIFQIDGAVGAVQNPVVCMDAKGDLSQIFIGCGFDHTVRVIDVNSQQVAPIGQHQGTIIALFWVESAQMILSISTDQTLKMWDVRAPGQPRFQCQFQYKPLVADFSFPLLVIGFAGEKLSIINMNEIQQLTGRFQYLDSPLGMYSQITSIALFPAKDGFGLGSIDGRGHLTNITTKQVAGMPTEFQLKSIMTFKAHKVEDNQKGKNTNYFFPVNSMQLNVKNPNFLLTAGGEGQMIFWDVQVRNKIRTFQFNCNPVICSKMSPDGSMLAYALGNDFSKGPEYFNEFPPKLCVHFIPDNELRCAR